MNETEKKLADLFQLWSGVPPVSVTRLPGSGSYRSYFRILGPKGTVIGAHNDDARENAAFISFTRHFRSLGLPVPKVLAEDLQNRIYLISDLGDTTLYELLSKMRLEAISAMQAGENNGSGTSSETPDIVDNVTDFPSEILEIYRKTLSWLPVLQVKADENLDYSVCYPRAAFDRQSMMWDLNYFKYYFLKLAKIPFDEQALEDDFAGLCDLLLEAPSDFFLFRDFQSRNIMVVNGEPWFIDYQGGRKGTLQYDVASLLYDGKADLPEPVRLKLLDYYLVKLEELYPGHREKFLETYYGFVLIRILQALGAYGFRGYYENKTHFLQSIPFALGNLRYLREHAMIGFGLHALMEVIDRMVDTPDLYHQQAAVAGNAGNAANAANAANADHADHADKADNADNAGVENNANNADDAQERVNENLPGLKPRPEPGPARHMLTVSIYSFSYKKVVPVDNSGNGGGFVFDCRALPNPGRYDDYKQLCGKDQPVIDFLKNETAVDEFLRSTFSLVDQSVSAYMDRGFEHLMVSYGCTGGQHRSVFCAEELAKYLRMKYKIMVKLIHTEAY